MPISCPKLSENSALTATTTYCSCQRWTTDPALPRRQHRTAEQFRLDQLHLLREFDHPRRRRADAQVIRPDRLLRLGFASVDKETFPPDRRRHRPQLRRLDPPQDQLGIGLADGEGSHAPFIGMMSP